MRHRIVHPLLVLTEGFQSPFLALVGLCRDRRGAGAPCSPAARGMRRRTGSRRVRFPSRTT